ncbi:adrenodoxin-like [Littorina saxatilis]|uniref:2Fe-2S ferredoxin-type domain-containing protein n=1 Tax=Littorina saxatilis TaxID=31220 RepID=A0AAN9BJ58_9CAEN
MAVTCAKLLRTVCPKFLLANRSACLTAPAFLPSRRQNFLQYQKKRFCSSVPRLKKETVTLTFLMPDGERIETPAKVGDNLLDVVIENDVDIDGFGACEGTLACSTCHLILKPEHYAQLPEPPTDEELDMLDLAFDLQDTSRLGCQVVVTKNMEGWEVRVPAGVADAREPS